MPTKEDKTCPSKEPCKHETEDLHVHVVCEACIDKLKRREAQLERENKILIESPSYAMLEKAKEAIKLLIEETTWINSSEYCSDEDIATNKKAVEAGKKILDTL